MNTRARLHEPAAPALLRELASGEAVAGNELAVRLGVTRAAVWKQVERLRELGLPVSAQAGLGYRLDAPLDWLQRDAILADLSAATRARVGDLALHWQLDSTSSELLRRAADDARSGLVCLTEVQTQGRGRRGRAWQMPLGGGIALSWLHRFDAGMAPLAGLSLVVGIAVLQALDDCGAAELGLKWPNDVVAQGRKLAGILVELGGDAIGPCHAVIGIGLNHRLGAAAGAAIDQPWIDLASLGVVATRNHIVARLITRLSEMLDRFAREGFADFAADYARFDVLRDRGVRVSRGALTSDGVARGVDARGALIVAFADGERSVDSGEVSIRVTP